MSDSFSFLLKKEGDLIEDAYEYVLAAAQHTILHGNSRNFRDALDALAPLGAITKTGRIAFNRRGATYRALQEALDFSKKEREEFVSLFPQYKGAPTEIMEIHAKSRAFSIADKFKGTFITER